ncbi:hypothetical protein PF005_g15371 [Phytophthora fragariae]|uniref:Uncharacterized protein n=1 Tax=Phytophthora fragariae TaxID=53985 RepID=A0A6A4DA25_9STRA|nr:hypothetical protein PF003_g3946 [Phytophthora fragariae]KAE9200365.1 hypothetical protein PF005_g15371 [Phytophthora fragariae]KAE9303796.1 hypothetical protein PF001_g13376 [Phytophthora fragariae]
MVAAPPARPPPEPHGAATSSTTTGVFSTNYTCSSCSVPAVVQEDGCAGSSAAGGVVQSDETANASPIVCFCGSRSFVTAELATSGWGPVSADGGAS